MFYGKRKKQIVSMAEIPQYRKTEALMLLKDLLCCLKSIHADIFYSALEETGFCEDERMRLVGSCFRIAAARKWMRKTSACVPSRRNHSNLLNVWISELHPRFAKSGPHAQAEIFDAYTFWVSQKLPPPDALAKKWESLTNGRKRPF